VQVPLATELAVVRKGRDRVNPAIALDPVNRRLLFEEIERALRVPFDPYNRDVQEGQPAKPLAGDAAERGGPVLARRPRSETDEQDGILSPPGRRPEPDWSERAEDEKRRDDFPGPAAHTLSFRRGGNPPRADVEEGSNNRWTTRSIVEA
jgi:hypothetical protein